MDKFLADISSVYWWLSVVVVGIILHFLNNYIDKLTEKSKSSFLEGRKKKLAEKKQQEEDTICFLVKHPELITDYLQSNNSIHSMIGTGIVTIYIASTALLILPIEKNLNPLIASFFGTFLFANVAFISLRIFVIMRKVRRNHIIGWEARYRIMEKEEKGILEVTKNLLLPY